MSRSLTLVALLSLSGGCFGRFALVQKLYEFNEGVSDSMVVKELVFLGLVLIPVYELALLGDAVIFNLIEFATGDNPVATTEVEGGQVRFERTTDGILVVTTTEAGEQRRVLRRRHAGWELTDEAGAVLGRVVRQGDRIEVVGPDGLPLASVDEGRLDEAWAAFQVGGSAAMREVLAPPAVWATLSP